MKSSVFIVSLLLVGGVASAYAHETWMMPRQFIAATGTEVVLDVTSGMAFPQPESPIQLSRIRNAAFRLGGKKISISKRKIGSDVLMLTPTFSSDGLATVWIALKPRDIDLSDDKVAEYLDEIDATNDIRTLWAELRGKVPWKETYTKHAKTFVAVGNAKNDNSWSRGVGAALEFLPTTSPLEIKVGAEFTVELRFQSKSYSGLPVGFLVEGVAKPVFHKSDSQGKATFRMTHPGRAIFFTVRLLFDKEKKTWVSDFCTMTVTVRPS